MWKRTGAGRGRSGPPPPAQLTGGAADKTRRSSSWSYLLGLASTGWVCKLLSLLRLKEGGLVVGGDLVRAGARSRPRRRGFARGAARRLLHLQAARESVLTGAAPLLHPPYPGRAGQGLAGAYYALFRHTNAYKVI